MARASQPFVRQNGRLGWLLKQSLYTHVPRLAALLALPWYQGLTGSILDVGAGTGALSLDLAWRVGAHGHVTAVDRDPEALAIARAIAGCAGVRVTALAGEVTALPIRPATQDTVVARFLFQHLPDPMAALGEMQQAARPGGRIAIFAVDDGLKLSAPPPSQPLQNLHEAIRALQSLRGGNRLIGRELYRMMREAGLQNIQVIVLPRVQLGMQNGRNAAAEAYHMERLLLERQALINAGLITAGEFELALSATRQRFAEDRFEMVAEVVATGLVSA
ncbi:MAG: methyltransferase domain-containing protein [Terriglobales bacterium]